MIDEQLEDTEKTCRNLTNLISHYPQDDLFQGSSGASEIGQRRCGNKMQPAIVARSMGKVAAFAKAQYASAYEAFAALRYFQIVPHQARRRFRRILWRYVMPLTKLSQCKLLGALGFL